jgi:hypothetical protein
LRSLAKVLGRIDRSDDSTKNKSDVEAELIDVLEQEGVADEPAEWSALATLRLAVANERAGRVDDVA